MVRERVDALSALAWVGIVAFLVAFWIGVYEGLKWLT